MHSDYWSGNEEHGDQPKRYICDSRAMLRLLMDEDIRAITGTMQILWIAERKPSSHELRLYNLVEQGKVFASNEGLYILR